MMVWTKNVQPVNKWIFKKIGHVKQQIKTSLVHDKWKQKLKKKMTCFDPAVGVCLIAREKDILWWQLFLRILYLFDSIFQG